MKHDERPTCQAKNAVAKFAVMMADFDYTAALVFCNTERYEKCLALCHMAGADARAQSLLAECHLQGTGVAEDWAKGVRLAQLSAAQGDPEGQRLLGVCRQQGLGVPKDKPMAVHLYRLSAAQGWAAGQRELGLALRQGEGVAPDEAEGRRLNQMACAQGNGQALNNEAAALGEKDLSEQLKLCFIATTSADVDVDMVERADTTAACADAARKLTGPASDDYDREFVKGIQLCADAAVASNEATHHHTAHLAAALDGFRAAHDPSAGDHNTPSPTACDVTLRAQGTDFPCHRLVLAAASHYFRTRFDSHFYDSRATTIQLDCEPATMERLVRYMYTGKLQPALGGVEDAAAVLEKAQYYQVDTLIQACAAYLEPRVGAFNSMLIEAVAVGALCVPLAEAARACTARDFALATTGAVFLACGIDTLAATLADEAVHAATEDAVLEAVLRWVEHDMAARSGHLLALLDHVRIARVSLPCFKYALASPAVASQLPVVMKLSVDYASRAQGDYVPADGGRGAKRQCTA